MTGQIRRAAGWVRQPCRISQSSEVDSGGVQRRFNDGIQARLGRTALVADSCHSYFQDPSGKVTTQWPGFMLEYRQRTRRIRRADYDFA